MDHNEEFEELTAALPVEPAPEPVREPAVPMAEADPIPVTDPAPVTDPVLEADSVPEAAPAGEEPGEAPAAAAEASAGAVPEAPKADPLPDYSGWNRIPDRPRRSVPGLGWKIGAALLALAVVAGSCGLTAWQVNRRWEERTQEMTREFNTRMNRLEDQLTAAQQGIPAAGQTGAVADTDGLLTPGQVYAANVNSVVAISNQSTTNVWGQVSETASSGSGFVLTSDGYIVTNYHVAEGAEKLTVITYMGDEYDARLVGFDAMNDVAILKIEAEGLDPVTVGDSDAMAVGDQVVAIGNPLGELTASLTVGYISAKDRTINTDGNLINMMQTDAAINSGNSGGPLFNMAGQVVGITTAKYSGSTASGASIEGIGFAIPINDVMNMSDDLIEHGYLTNQAYFGISVMDLPQETAERFGLPAGSYVRGVVEGSCAETAGVAPKDIIIAIGEYTVEGNTTLSAALRNFSAGESTTVTVWRDSVGGKLQLPITFDERPRDPDAEQAADPRLPGEMPSNGSYEEWYEYFAPYFGEGNS